MNYPNGDKIKLGDTLKLWDGCTGVVVFSIDDDQYSEDFSKKDWGYLKVGVLIDTDAAGLVHYEEPESSFELISRGT